MPFINEDLKKQTQAVLKRTRLDNIRVHYMAPHHQEYSRRPKKNNAAQIPVILATRQQELTNA